MPTLHHLIGFSSANHKYHYLYNACMGAINRCNNPNHPRYLDYGNRGINVYPEWIDNVEAFALWILLNIGERPFGHTLDRIDNGIQSR